MKQNKFWPATALAASLVLGCLASSPAVAERHGHEHGEHGHWGVGVVIGPSWGQGWGPGWGPGWGYGPAYGGYYAPYYPPAVVTVPAPQPPVYVERDDNGVQNGNSEYYWYHCDKPDGYYPYIKRCPSGWQRVVPQAPPSR